MVLIAFVPCASLWLEDFQQLARATLPYDV
jgi:hypothetical protein